MATVFIPDIFGAYLQGKRAAIQDNWQDLSNYNTVLKGQLANAATMANFGDAVRQKAAESLSKQATALSNAAGLDQMLALLQAQNQLGVTAAQAAATLRGLNPPIQQQQQTGATAPTQQGLGAAPAGQQMPGLPTPAVRNPMPPAQQQGAAPGTDATTVSAMTISNTGSVDLSSLTPEQSALYNQLVASGTPEDQAYDAVVNQAG